MNITTPLFLAAAIIHLTVARAAEPHPWSNFIGENVAESRAKWQGLTQGEDLARGKPVHRFHFGPLNDRFQHPSGIVISFRAAF